MRGVNRDQCVVKEGAGQISEALRRREFYLRAMEIDGDWPARIIRVYRDSKCFDVSLFVSSICNPCSRHLVDRAVDFLFDGRAISGFQIEFDFHLHDWLQVRNFQKNSFAVG